MTDVLPEKGASIDDFTGRIWWGEALDLLSRLPDKSIDMILVDLPYGVTACAWDTVIPFEPMWQAIKRVAKKKSAIVMTATEPFASKLRMSNEAWYRYDWVWDKVLPTGLQIAKYRPMQQHEIALVFGQNSPNYYPIMVERDKPKIARMVSPSDSSPLKYRDDRDTGITYTYTYPKSILKFSNANQPIKEHSTQKPVALFEYLIKTYTKEGEIVLDFCSGSGTTAIACTNLDRRFICADLHEPYVIASRERLARHDPMQNSPLKNGMVQKSLFASLLDDNPK